MVYPRFSEQWLENYTDPFAVLGLSVLADDRRTRNRHHHIAKLLHPDALMSESEQERAIAAQFLARLVNPAYKQINRHQGRAEQLATLRFVVRQQMDEVNPTTEWGRSLLKTPIIRVETVYEQAIAELSENQYSPLDNFETTTAALSELNRIYLRLKIGEPMVREKRFGLMAPPSDPKTVAIETKPVNFNQRPPSYAQRHYMRAEEYLKKGSVQKAISELKDAIKLESDQSKYHALLAKAYLMQKLPGAAKAYCRRALNLDPQEPLALKCAKYLKLESSDTQRNRHIPSEKPLRNRFRNSRNTMKSKDIFSRFVWR